MSTLRVRDLMTSKVFSVGPNESIASIQDLMRKRHIRLVPVVDGDGAVLGVVSERDVVGRTLFDADNASEIMSWRVETVDADAPASRAAQIMLDHRYGCLPVVARGALAGILTEADFVKSAAARQPSRTPSSGRGRRHRAA
jgi:CBS domain-containing membrane protein